eukprot:1143659-Pelagomonas_calceolata.AAC.5
MLKSCGFPEAFVCRGLDHWCRSDIFIIPFKTDLQAKLSNSVMKGRSFVTNPYARQCTYWTCPASAEEAQDVLGTFCLSVHIINIMLVGSHKAILVAVLACTEGKEKGGECL